MKWLDKLWRKKISEYYTVDDSLHYKKQISNDVPEIVKSGTVYLVGENGNFWCLVFECPCGCKDVIHLNLLREASPRWTTRISSDNAISISPSIWRRVDCKSHFFIKRGLVIWCGKSTYSYNR